MNDFNEDSMDFDDSDDDSSDFSNDKDSTYKVMTIDEISDNMEQSIQAIVSPTEMPASIARIALSQHNWDKQDLLSKFFDDQDKFFQKINVLNPFQEVATTSTASTSANIGECLTCYGEYPSIWIVSLSCNHMFCKDCWAQYLTVKINEGSELISCQNHNCNIIVDDPMVNQLLTDDKVKARYKRWITNNFVLSDASLEWCPGPDCTNAIKAENTSKHLLNCACDCGYEFCFKCREAPHEPLPCDLFKTWQNQSNDATMIYMLKNIKPCPKCDCPIEKNQGCDYMYCTRCRTEFCWVCFKKCFQDWRYGHGMCNTPVAERPPVNYNAIRYERYNSRYEDQKKSFDLEKKIIAITIERASEKSVKGEGILQGDIKMFKNSFGVLLECRKSLMMSYIFAYFLIEGNQKDIFETNQRDLVDAVATLSEHLQKIDACQNLAELNTLIKDKTEYCDHRRMMLHDHISEGLFKRSWEFFDKAF